MAAFAFEVVDPWEGGPDAPFPGCDLCGASCLDAPGTGFRTLYAAWDGGLRYVVCLDCLGEWVSPRQGE